MTASTMPCDHLGPVELCSPRQRDASHSVARMPCSLGARNLDLVLVSSNAIPDRLFLCIALCVEDTELGLQHIPNSSTSYVRRAKIRADKTLSYPTYPVAAAQSFAGSSPIELRSQSYAEIYRVRHGQHPLLAISKVIVVPVRVSSSLSCARQLVELAKSALRCIGRLPSWIFEPDAEPPLLALHGVDGEIVAYIRTDPPQSSTIVRQTEWIVEKFVEKKEVVSDDGIDLLTEPGSRGSIYRGSPVYQAVRALLHQDCDMLRRYGAKPISGLLLSGPPGIGKTVGVRSAAKDSGYSIVSVSHQSDKGGHGAQARALRVAFSKAQSNGKAIVFLDELDGFCPKRSGSGVGVSQPMETVQTVAQLLALMDGGRAGDQIIFVIAATNRSDAIDPALRRPGRFDRELAVQAPNEEERLKFLAAVEPTTDRDILKTVAMSTPGFVAADLVQLCAEALKIAVEGGSADPQLRSSDFMDALRNVRPSLLRGGLSTELIRTSWDDIGGSDETKERLRMAVEWPLKHASTYKRLGLTTPRGLLLHGPPGCSKTTLVRAAATASRSNFLHISGADVYSCYLGEAERILRGCFDAARAAAPSILFIDEIDAIVGKRDARGAQDGGNDVKDRVLSTMLTELDGITSCRGVVVIGATNRVDLLDDALLRPGRFDEIVQVGLPGAAERCQILQIHAGRLPLADDVDLDDVARLLRHGCSGAEIAAVCQEAGLLALREVGYSGVQAGSHGELKVRTCHLVQAIVAAS